MLKVLSCSNSKGHKETRTPRVQEIWGSGVKSRAICRYRLIDINHQRLAFGVHLDSPLLDVDSLWLKLEQGRQLAVILDVPSQGAW